ncbi:MAG: hypothetical protein LBF05_05780 [Tannerella sp.]|jgi:hypothetical protein|nr:hypothetical protein [Tannerella sp.]
MKYEKEILEIRRRMRRALELPMQGCCAHRKEDLAFYLNPCENSHYDSFIMDEYPNGFYFGCMKDEKKHGFGYFIWNDDTMYVGDWKDDDLDGDGIYFRPNEYILFGKFSAGKPNGRCFIRNNNGNEIEVDMENDIFLHIYPSSDDFTDSEGKEYTRENNYSGIKPPKPIGFFGDLILSALKAFAIMILIVIIILCIIATCI